MIKWDGNYTWKQRLRRVHAALCLIGASFLVAALPATACDGIPAGTTLWVQLLSEVSSYDAKPGTAVEAVLEEDIKCENGVVFPIGTHVKGKVRRVQKVGWGIWHETAAIDLEFDRVLPEEDILPK